MEDIWKMILIFGAGTFASFIGSQVGGGSSIIIPMLIFFGIPPHAAVATNKLAALCGSSTSAYKFFKAKKIIWKYVLPLAVINVIGSLIGVRIFFEIDSDLLGKLVGVVILLPLPFLFKKKLGLERRNVPKYMIYIGAVLYFLLTIWSGVFTPGSLTLMLYLLISFLGLTFVEAAATHKIPSIASRITLVTIFLFAGLVDFRFGIPLFASYIFGSYLGASFAIKKGNVWVRGLLAVVVVLSSVKLLFFS
jgi:uncharacterized protein